MDLQITAVERAPVPAPMRRVASRLLALPPVGSRELADRAAAARRRGVDVLSLAPYPVRPVPSHVAATSTRGLWLESHE